MCELEARLSPCNETGFEWETSPNWQLIDCIGYDGENCRIQFLTMLRSQIYCENNPDCVGVNEQPCTYHGYGEGISCVGTRWIPYKTLQEGFSEFDYFINRYLQPDLTPEEQEKEIEENLDYDWDEPVLGSWDHCADYKIDSSGNCFYSFNTSAEAKKYCEELDLLEALPCDGVTTQEDGSFIAISGITFDTKSKQSEIILKLRRIWKYIRSTFTEDGKLTELWSQEMDGYLTGCADKAASLNREAKCETFDNLFEAKYYCESLGDICGGVTFEATGI